MWTPEELTRLIENYRDTPWDQLLKMFPGRSKGAIGQMGRIFAKRVAPVTPKFIEKGKRTRFKKGLVPWNKGKRQHEYMSAEAIDRTKATRFKKGNVPHNTCSDFDISPRKDKTGRVYFHIRIAKGQWVLLHRWIYQKHHNVKLSPAKVVTFKDGDSSNCKVSNLELISKADNMARNTIHRYKELDPELYETIYALIGLKESITFHQQKGD